VLSTLIIDDDYEIADINLRIDSLTHTYVGDLSAMLCGPTGYGVDLIYLQGGAISGGGSGDNFINTVIDGQATGDLLSAPNSSAPFTGSWKPAFNSPSWGGISFDNVAADPIDQLSRFNGTSTAGVWSLLVADSYSGDAGTLDSWSLIIAPKAYTCTPYLSVVRARISLPVVVK
jgi:hypothetical protein